jgi:hypothetical protein
MGQSLYFWANSPSGLRGPAVASLCSFGRGRWVGCSNTDSGSREKTICNAWCNRGFVAESGWLSAASIYWRSSAQAQRSGRSGPAAPPKMNRSQVQRVTRGSHEASPRLSRTSLAYTRYSLSRHASLCRSAALATSSIPHLRSWRTCAQPWSLEFGHELLHELGHVQIVVYLAC